MYLATGNIKICVIRVICVLLKTPPSTELKSLTGLYQCRIGDYKIVTPLA